MKANETPEKIYIANNVFPTHIDWDGAPINSKRIDKTDIEYIRTDAFIEKAYTWFDRKFHGTEISDKYGYGENINIVMAENVDKYSLIDEFINYIKGE